MNRHVISRKRKKVQNALKNKNEIEAKVSNFQNKNNEELVRLVDIFSKAESHDFNDLLENTESNTFTTYSKILKDNDEFLISPSSMFRQNSKKSRKSLDESIFLESDSDSKDIQEFTDYKEKTNKMNIENSEDEDNSDSEEDDSDDEKEKPLNLDKNPSAEKETSNVPSLTSNVNKTYRKSFSERLNTENDTSLLLKNIDQFNRVGTNNDSDSRYYQPSTFKSSMSSFKKTFNAKTTSNISNLKSRSNNSGFFAKIMGDKIKNSNSTLIAGHNSNTSSNPKKSFNNGANRHKLFAFDFDKPKEFKFFFPYNNISEVINEAKINTILRESHTKKGKIKKVFN